MSDIKILMLGNAPSVKGGITSVITQLLEHNWNDDNIKMNFIPTYIEAGSFKKILFFAKAYKRIRRELKVNKPDIVHIHMSYKGSFTRKNLIHKLCKKQGIADIIHLHGSEFKKWYDESDDKKKEEIRKLLRECKAFIVLGNKWDSTIKQIEPETNTVVVQNSVSIPKETVKWNKPFQVLFLGVLIQRKGVGDLLEAVNILKENGSIKKGDTRFVIAGSGAEEENLKAQCKKLGLEEFVTFAGWTAGEAKTKLIRESQMLVLPSYNEGLPVAILEAISYGMPIVSTDVGDISSAVRQGENGFLFKPGDIDALAGGLEKIISHRETYEKMADSSRKIAENEFSDEKTFAKLKECYKKIVKG